MRVGGFTSEGLTGDLSVSGALLVANGPETLIGQEGELTLDRVGTTPCRVVGASRVGLHIQFVAPSRPFVAAIAGCLAEAQATNERFTARCKEAAAATATAFERALAEGRVTQRQLFDVVYRPIPDTDPQQHLSDAAAICDEVTPAIIEPVKASDPDIVFCLACDRRGYIATHNREYSKPQRPGDRLWNTANSRNRRIFDDRTGLLAARNTNAVLVQAYPRDMGGGRIVMLKEYDSPIVVQGRHWGAIRLAVRLPGAV